MTRQGKCAEGKRWPSLRGGIRLMRVPRFGRLLPCHRPIPVGIDGRLAQIVAVSKANAPVNPGPMIGIRGFVGDGSHPH